MIEAEGISELPERYNSDEEEDKDDDDGKDDADGRSITTVVHHTGVARTRAGERRGRQFERPLSRNH